MSSNVQTLNLEPIFIFEEENTVFDRDISSATVIDHDPSMEMANGTLAVTFTTDSISYARQGLISKDASGFGNGGHFGVLIENNDLRIRMQDSDSQSEMIIRDVISPGQEHNLFITFGDAGLNVYLDGALVGNDANWTHGLQGNNEPLVVGANAWASGSENANNLEDAFDGTISSVQFYDLALSATDVAVLAGTDAPNTNNDPDNTVDAGTNGSSANDSADTSADTASSSSFITPNEGGTVYYSSDLGWASGSNVSTELTNFMNNTFQAGDTLVLDAMYKVDGLGLSFPQGSVLAAINGGGFDVQTSSTQSNSLFIFKANTTVDNVTVTYSNAPNTGTTHALPERGVDYHDIKTFAVQGDNFTMKNTSFHGNVAIHLDIRNSKNVQIIDSEFDGGWYQMRVLGSSDDTLVSGSRFKDSLGDGIKTTGATIDGQGFNPQRLTVKDSLFDGNNRDGIDTAGGGKDMYVTNSIFYNNKVSALDIKTSYNYPEEFNSTYSNSGILIENSQIITSTNAITVTLNDRIGGVVNDSNYDELAPHDIQVNNVVFENPFSTTGSRTFLIKDGHHINWSDIEIYGNVQEPRIMNLLGQTHDIGGTTAHTGDPRGLTLDDLWPYEAGAINKVMFDSDNADASDGDKTDTATVDVTVNDAADTPAPFMTEGEHTFNANTNDTVIIDHDPSMEIANGTIAMTFTADTVQPSIQGLLTKDAAGYGNGGHFGILMQGNDLRIRMQDADSQSEIVIQDVITAGTEHNLALTFGDEGLNVYLDGSLIGNDSNWTHGLQGNHEPLLIGANQWGSQAESASKIEHPFDGTVSSVELYDVALSAADVAVLANSSPANEAPVATDDAINMDEDTSSVIDVISNDSDPEGDALSVANFSQGTNGSVTENADGTLTYTPDADFFGTDSFTYTVTDGDKTDTATVNVIVNDVADIPVPLMTEGEHTFNANKNDTVIIDHDPSMEIANGTLAVTFTVDSVNLARQGLVSKDAAGYGNGGHFGVLIENNDLRIRMQDSDSQSEMIIRDVISPGQEHNLAMSFGEDGLNIYLDGSLIGNDANWIHGLQGNHEPLLIGANQWGSQAESASKIEHPFDGTISSVALYDIALSADEIFTLANVSVEPPAPVNEAPVATDDAITMDEDTSSVIDVISNDSDPEGDALSVANFSQGTNGSVTENADGTLTYTPDADFFGTDSFTYTVTDGDKTDTATVNVIVNDVIDLPIPFMSEAAHIFNADKNDTVIIDHDPSMEIANGTIAMTFTADTVQPSIQGLLTKDAAGYGNGGHFGILMQGNDLRIRMQDADSQSEIVIQDVITAGTEHNLALTFGDEGLNVYLDGSLIGNDSNWTHGLQGNHEPLLIGANQWGSQAESASKIEHPFDGTVSSVELYDVALTPIEVSALAGTEDTPTTEGPVENPDNTGDNGNTGGSTDTPADTGGSTDTNNDNGSASSSSFILPNEGGTVYYSSDLGWASGSNVSTELTNFMNNTFQAGDTLVLDAMYKVDGLGLSFPQGSVLAAVNGGGFDVQTSSNQSAPLFYIQSDVTVDNLSIIYSNAPNTGTTHALPERGVDYHDIRTFVVHGDNFEMKNTSFSGNVSQHVDLKNSKNAQIIDSMFEGGFYQLRILGSSDDALISGSRFKDALGDGIKTTGATINGQGFNPQRLTVKDSLFDGNNRDGIDTAGGAQDMYVTNSIFYNNKVSAFDLKQIYNNPEDLNSTYSNTGIVIENTQIINSNNGIVVTLLDRMGIVNTSNYGELAPHDIQVNNVVFENTESAGNRTFLIKDGHTINWSDIEVYGNVEQNPRIMNVTGQSYNIGGTTAHTGDPRGLTVDELWPYEAGVTDKTVLDLEVVDVYGTSANDTLYVGEGLDYIDVSNGDDTVVFTIFDNTADIIHGFQEGDVIDISQILDYNSAVDDAIADFVAIVQNGDQSEIQVNTDGQGSDFIAVAIIEGGIDQTVDQLINNGSLII